MTDVLDPSPRETASPIVPATTGRFESLLVGEHEPSLSELWHKVALTRPRLAPHAQVIRQSFGPHVLYVVEDPAAGHFYRLSESAYFFLGLLDGRITIDEAWQSAGAQLGDDAPTQRECVELLGKLQLFGLLVGDLPLSTEMVAERQLMARRQEFQRRTGRGMAFLIPLVNPERLLEAIAPALRIVFSRAGFVVWSLLIIAGLATGLGSWRQLGSQFNQILDPANLAWLGVLLLLIRAWHEFGHACACKAMGGRCTEIGLMLVAYVLPFPYCDATSAWRFPEIRRRIIVAAGGVLFEAAAASVAVMVWAITEPGLIKTLAFNTVIISGVTTVIFNLNPLLRYDGYYILSDILGAPNLSQRANELWRFVFEKFVFRIRSPRPPTLRSTGEAVSLLIYAALSWPYRMFVTLSLVAIVGGRYLSVGVLLASLLFVLWFVWPILKGLNYLLTSPRLLGRRGRAFGVVGAALALMTVLLAIIPFPAAGFASGTVEPLQREPVRSLESGFTEQILVAVGDTVRQGQPMFVMSSPEAQSELSIAVARVEGARAEIDSSPPNNPAKREVARLKLEAAQRDLEQAHRAVVRLTITAPIAGRVHASGGQVGLANLVGRFVKRGELFAEILADERLIIKTSLSDREHSYIFRGPPETWTSVRAVARIRGNAGDAVPCKVTRVAPAASNTIASRAASTIAGGDIAVDPSDKNQSRTLVPQFVVEVEPVEPDAALKPGQYARVRLAAPSEPLIQQWIRKARQYLAARWAT